MTAPQHEGAVQARPTFDAANWLDDFTTLGGGYVEMPERRIAFLTAGIFAPDLAMLMRQVVGWPERLGAVKTEIGVRARKMAA